MGERIARLQQLDHLLDRQSWFVAPRFTDVDDDGQAQIVGQGATAPQGLESQMADRVRSRQHFDSDDVGRVGGHSRGNAVGVDQARIAEVGEMWADHGAQRR